MASPAAPPADAAGACVFCRILRGELPAHTVRESADFLAFLDVRPINPGHLLLIPRVHVDQLFELPEPSYRALFDQARLLAGPLRAATGALRIGVAVEGFGVPHVHVHLVPLNGGAELNPERARSAAPGELEAMRTRLIAALKAAG